MKKIKRLFLLSHCDDEIFLLPFLLDSNSESVVCFFSTRHFLDGSKNIRQLEANKVRTYLNYYQQVHFVFMEPELSDGHIYRDFSKLNFDFIGRIIKEFEPDELLTLAFEGGHQDHDTVEFISRVLSKNYHLQLISCPAYSSASNSEKFFRVMKTDLPTEKIHIRRLRVIWAAVRIMTIYRSQFKSWLGLAPLILLRYSFYSFRVIRVELSMEIERFSRCFYESRKRASQEEVMTRLRLIFSYFGTQR